MLAGLSLDSTGADFAHDWFFSTRQLSIRSYSAGFSRVARRKLQGWSLKQEGAQRAFNGWLTPRYQETWARLKNQTATLAAAPLTV